MSNIHKFRKFHHWPFSNSQPKLNVAIFNRRHLLRKKLQIQVKSQGTRTSLNSHLAFLICVQGFSFHTVLAYLIHTTDLWGRKVNITSCIFRGASVLQGEMEVQGSYMTCSNPALRGRAGTITCSTDSQWMNLSVYYNDVLVQRQTGNFHRYLTLLWVLHFCVFFMVRESLHKERN